jgi:hypothetical protein
MMRQAVPMKGVSTSSRGVSLFQAMPSQHHPPAHCPGALLHDNPLTLHN